MATRKTDAASGAGMVSINRAPVLALWAAVVAERLGHDHDVALTLGRALSGLNAQSKGRRLGLFSPPAPGTTGAHRKAARPAADDHVELMGRAVPVVRTRDGVRAAPDGKPDDPRAVERYLEARFGEALPAARAAMVALAAAFGREELAERAFALYEAFRPSIPAGTRGWGARGTLDLGRVRALAGAGRTR